METFVVYQLKHTNKNREKKNVFFFVIFLFCTNKWFFFCFLFFPLFFSNILSLHAMNIINSHQILQNALYWSKISLSPLVFFTTNNIVCLWTWAAEYIVYVRVCSIYVNWCWGRRTIFSLIPLPHTYSLYSFWPYHSLIFSITLLRFYVGT